MFSMLDPHLLNLKSVFVTTSQLCLRIRKFVRWPFILMKFNEFKDFEFVAIEKVDLVNDENANNPLLTREAYWMAQLCTSIALMASIRDLNFDQKIGSITSCNNYYNYNL